MTYYLHTIDGKPAYFSRMCDAVVLRSGFGPPQPMATSLAQIKREQRITIKWRKEHNLQIGDYGHVRVHVAGAAPNIR